MRKPLLVTGTAMSAALLLVGCSGGGGLRSVEISDDERTAGEAPSIDFETPIKVEGNETKVLEEGDGEEIDPGDTLMVQMSIYGGGDKSELGESYSQRAGQVLSFDDDLKERVPELYEAMEGMKVGGVVAYSSDATAGQSGTEGDDSTAVEVYEIVDEIPSGIDGEMKDSPDGLPTVTEDDNGDPTIAAPEGEAPEEVTSEYLIEGDGEEVGEGDTVVADYVGVRWDDGEVFDSSYESGSPAALPLDTMIPGWAEALEGKKTGSRVIMSIPAEKAYGTAEELGEDSEYPAGDLVFVVDLLASYDTPEPEPLPDPTADVVNEGDGEEVEDGDTLLVRTGPVADGEPQQEQDQVMRVDDDLAESDQFVHDQLAQARVGTSVDITSSTDDGTGQVQETTVRYTVQEILPETPDGEMAASTDGLPQVTEGEDGTPQIETPSGDAPDEVVTQTLIAGDGAEVQADDTVAVDYVGVRWEDGEVFDSSYERGVPTAFPLSAVISGWSEGLEGQKVGSRVLISIPADKAYGTQEEVEAEGSGSPAGDLLFVVDILGAAESPQPSEAPTDDGASDSATADDQASAEG
ncbi:FKBP-type peptidyl-prolyl cis-trans isomerase [Kocuria sp. p3-SID1433]|uniref:FKBP-type peptidyl-prolyl cis-trans isomerase n=1 Tax=unclassified Kocuria TaxID=2649579 RepID=UPI0021A6EA2D|nr:MULTISPECIES: FKBP-type peptidyl-prolyl cis-trans isomerase [unclassified Kocuria]MCT1602734.1 FKBP-type peptidyl-prolyl cis-trans isomerase [Kocuria sp. p3-SID1428]MCT2180642.1 FKBP-type peptidyl-prolyl cis-trans isomerase [Kocuria sp. p3-SID1433]